MGKGKASWNNYDLIMTTAVLTTIFSLDEINNTGSYLKTNKVINFTI